MENSFGERLQNLRAKKNLSQQQLASLIGISRKQISDYESRDSLPRSRTLYKLAEALNVSPSFLLHGVEDEPIEREAVYDRPITTASKLYISSSLKQKIEDATKESGRSINAEAVHRLEKSFELNLEDNLKKDIQIALLQNQIENMSKFMQTLEGFIKALIEGNGDEYLQEMLEKAPKIKKMYEEGLFDDEPLNSSKNSFIENKKNPE